MSDKDTGGRLSPDDAFAALSNEQRVRILRELGDAGSPLAFSELYDRLPVDDTARFNYHLGELRGHFVRKTADGYALDHPGQRVVEAIRSGAVTDDPEIERTTVDDRCPTCESPLEVQWLDGSVEVFCSVCESRWDRSHGRVGGPGEVESGYLGRLPFPPAGLRDRTPTEVLRAAHTWTNLELLAVGSGICPRCAAAVETELDACPDHDGDGVCRTAGRGSRCCCTPTVPTVPIRWVAPPRSGCCPRRSCWRSPSTTASTRSPRSRSSALISSSASTTRRSCRGNRSVPS